VEIDEAGRDGEAAGVDLDAAAGRGQLPADDLDAVACDADVADDRGAAAAVVDARPADDDVERRHRSASAPEVT
jgi:hypothetical protein